MIQSGIRRSSVAVAAFAGLATSVFATQVVFHPHEELPGLRLFPHDGDVVVTWQHGISHLDAASLEITDVDTAQHFLVPMPVEGSEEFFYARLGAAPDQLKALRGTAAAVLAEQIDPGDFTGAGGHLFFTTHAPGLDVRASDGTPQGTGLLVDIDPAWTPPCQILCDPSFNYPGGFSVSASGRIYFMAFTSGLDGSSHELWTRDPAAEFPGLPPAPAPASRLLKVLPEDPLFSIATSDGQLFFLMNEPFSIAALWRSDGTAAGTRRIKIFTGLGSPGLPIHDPVELNGQLYFIVEEGARRQLWKSDGSEAGTALVRDFGLGLRVAALWKHAGRLYLPLDAEGRGEELWTSDGTAAGTRLVADIGQGLAGAKPRAFAPLPDGRFAISLDDGVHGQEPWISDGTAAGTHLVADALPGPAGTDPADFVAGGDRLFFIGSNGRGSRTPAYVELVLEAACPADQLCLQNGRFRVETFWTAAGESGKGKRAVASGQAGLFSFFSPDNWEVMVKVLDGCAINDRFWVFASAATDVQYEIRVTDLESGLVKSYPFAGGAPAPATTDVEAFATCPND